MTMTGWRRLVMLVAAVAAAAPALASPQDAGTRARRDRMRPGMESRLLGGPEWWNNPETVEQLGLDEATRKKIDDEVYRTQQEMIGLRAEVERQQLEMERLFESESIPALGAIEAQVDRFVGARGAVLKSELLLRAKIKGMLTPEQRAKLEQIHEERRRQFRERMQGNPGAPDAPSTPSSPGQQPPR